MLTVTRKQQLLKAFRTAGRRGLTAGEMQQAVGVLWRLRLSELRDDGCTFCEIPSRLHLGKTFRWVLVLEPRLNDETGELDERLFDLPATPSNAIDGDV